MGCGGGVETSSCLYKRRLRGIESACEEGKLGRNVAFDVCVFVCRCACVFVKMFFGIKYCGDHADLFFLMNMTYI